MSRHVADIDTDEDADDLAIGAPGEGIGVGFDHAGIAYVALGGDGGGWYWVACKCGWCNGPFPGPVEAADDFEDHRFAVSEHANAAAGGGTR